MRYRKLFSFAADINKRRKDFGCIFIDWEEVFWMPLYTKKEWIVWQLYCFYKVVWGISAYFKTRSKIFDCLMMKAVHFDFLLFYDV